MLCLLAASLTTERTSAAIRMEVDPVARGIVIEVADTDPPVIELTSDDLLPIRWERQGQRRAVLPVVLTRASRELVIVDDARVSHAMSVNGPLPRVVITPDLYASLARWHGQPDAQQRNRIMGVALLFALGLLLTLLSRRQPTWLAAAYCVVWASALCVWTARSPALVAAPLHPEVPVDLYFARSAQTLRISCDDTLKWIPMVESDSHLRALDARIEVQGDGERVWFVYHLPPNGKLCLTSVHHADAQNAR